MAGSHPPPRAALVVAFRRVRTQVVCMHAKLTQRWMQVGGIGSARVMRDEAAALLEPCGKHGHCSRFLSFFFLPERGWAGEGIDEQKFFLHRPHG